MPNDAPAPAEADTVDTASQQAAPITDDWRSSLPDEIRENSTLGKYKDVGALASAHINLQSHLGRDKITKPVSESDWDEVYNFLGRPETSADYALSISEETPDAVKAQFSDEGLNAFRERAHALGLNADQAQGLLGWYAETQSAQYGAMEDAKGTSLADAEQALHDEWGHAYEQNVSFAVKAAQEYGGDELLALMEETGLGNHPAMVKAFANIARTTMADTDLVGKETARSLILSPEEAKAEAASIMAHPAYTDRHHPEHASMVKKVTTLFEQAYR